MVMIASRLVEQEHLRYNLVDQFEPRLSGEASRSKCFWCGDRRYVRFCDSFVVLHVVQPMAVEAFIIQQYGDLFVWNEFVTACFQIMG